MYGAMMINGKRYVWDYALDKAVPEEEMRPGGDRWNASEKAKFERLKIEFDDGSSGDGNGTD